MTKNSCEEDQNSDLDDTQQTDDMLKSTPIEDSSSESNLEQDSPEEPNEIDVLRANATESHDKYLRISAELDNYRKRADRDIENARLYGVERFAQAMLTVRDSLEAGLIVEQANVEAVLEGKKATLRLLDAVFEEFGIEVLDPEAEPFDPKQHEAITLAASNTVEPDTVILSLIHI